MSRCSVLGAAAGLVLSILGCMPAATGWRHFHGDLSGQGFLNVKSGYALSPAWKSEPLRIVGSSPVVGRDVVGLEVVYVGTADAFLAAVEGASGAVRWRRFLGEAQGRSSIVSAPTVGADGGVMVLTTTASADGRLGSSLHKVDWTGSRRWSYPLPDGVVALGSPKGLDVAGRRLALVQSFAGGPDGPRSELMLVGDAGDKAELIARGVLGGCAGGAASQARVLNTWKRLSADPAGAVIDPADVSLEPTPAAAMVGSRLLIAIAGHRCRAAVFEWGGSGLVKLWETPQAHDGISSPVILPNRRMVIGRRDGKLLAYDMETGVKMWEYDAGEPILSTPAGSAQGIVFAASTGHLHAVHADHGGGLLPSGAVQRLKIPGPSLSSPAVTAECLYVPSGEMITVSHDFKVRSYSTAFAGSPFSSPAVGAGGSVYVVAADGSLWKYKGAD
jgi:outer membrane protein assembly factor BamB